MGIVDSLNAGWTQLLDLLSKVIIPDWTSVVGLLPILIVLGVVGPIFTILMLFWLWYFVTKPRRAVVQLAEGPYPAPIGSDGYPIFPPGEPYCYHDALVYPPGATRCETCGRELLVRERLRRHEERHDEVVEVQARLADEAPQGGHAAQPAQARRRKGAHADEG